MILDNFINIVCEPGKGESELKMQYPDSITVSELITTLELAKRKILEVYNNYNDKNGIFETEEMEELYFRTEIKKLIDNG